MQEDKVNASDRTGSEKPLQPPNPLTQEQINALLEIHSPRKKDGRKWLIGLLLGTIVIGVGFSSWAISHYLSKVKSTSKTSTSLEKKANVKNQVQSVYSSTN